MMSYINLAMFHIVLSKQMLFQGDIILKKQIKKTWCHTVVREYVLQLFLCLYMYLQNKRICITSISMFIYVLTEQRWRRTNSRRSRGKALYMLQFSVISICELCLSMSLMSFLPWFISIFSWFVKDYVYMFMWYVYIQWCYPLQFLNNVIINKTKVLLP